MCFSKITWAGRIIVSSIEYPVLTVWEILPSNFFVFVSWIDNDSWICGLKSSPSSGCSLTNPSWVKLVSNLLIIISIPSSQPLKALSVGAKCCSGGKFYLYALGAGGQPAVEKALSNFKAEIERDMKLMGCSKISDLNRDNLRYREKYK